MRQSDLQVWKVQCDCGNRAEVFECDLVSGAITSCGPTFLSIPAIRRQRRIAQWPPTINQHSWRKHFRRPVTWTLPDVQEDHLKITERLIRHLFLNHDSPAASAREAFALAGRVQEASPRVSFAPYIRAHSVSRNRVPARSPP